MQHLEVSGAVRHIYIYIYIYVVRRPKRSKRFTFCHWEFKDFNASELGEKTCIAAAHCHLAR